MLQFLCFKLLKSLIYQYLFNVFFGIKLINLVDFMLRFLCFKFVSSIFDLSTFILCLREF